jgi:hypothetical protein
MVGIAQAHKPIEGANETRHYLTRYDAAGQRWLWGKRKDAKSFASEVEARSWAAKHLANLGKSLVFPKL